jgi:hypothetical protein
MILWLFLGMVAIALVLIIIGMLKPTESAQALIGFTLLFILAMVVLTGNLSYPVGNTSNITVTELGGNITKISQNDVTHYQTYSESTTHNIGLYLAIGSAVGVIGVIVSLRRNRNYD